MMYDVACQRDDSGDLFRGSWRVASGGAVVNELQWLQDTGVWQLYEDLDGKEAEVARLATVKSQGTMQLWLRNTSPWRTECESTYSRAALATDMVKAN